MATKTFVGTVNNLWSRAENWSASGTPLSTDDVVINASSPNVTIDTDAYCQSLTCTNFTNTLTFNKNLNLFKASSASIIFGTAMTLSAGTANKGFVLTGIFSINSNNTICPVPIYINRHDVNTPTTITLSTNDLTLTKGIISDYDFTLNGANRKLNIASADGSGINGNNATAVRSISVVGSGTINFSGSNVVINNVTNISNLVTMTTGVLGGSFSLNGSKDFICTGGTLSGFSLTLTNGYVGNINAPNQNLDSLSVLNAFATITAPIMANSVDLENGSYLILSSPLTASSISVNASSLVLTSPFSADSIGLSNGQVSATTTTSMSCNTFSLDSANNTIGSNISTKVNQTFYSYAGYSFSSITPGVKTVFVISGGCSQQTLADISYSLVDGQKTINTNSSIVQDINSAGGDPIKIYGATINTTNWTPVNITTVAHNFVG